MPSGRLLIAAALVTSFAVVAVLGASPGVSAAPDAARDEAPALAQAPDDLAVTGWVLQGTRNAVVRRNAGGIDMLSVSGVGISQDGSEVAAPGRDHRRLLQAARRLGLQAELLVTNYSNRIQGFDPRIAHRLLSSRANIDAVAEQLAGYVVDGGWDGVNIDLERLRGRDARGLTAFVQALQDQMPEELTVTVDVSASHSLQSYRSRGYRLTELGAAADVIKLMTYDMHGPTWSRPGPIGDLAWQRRTLEAALLAVPPVKVDLGVAGYGYSWPKKRTGTNYSPRTMRAKVERAGVRARWDADAGEWTATLPNGTVLWWSDRRSYAKRVDLAREYGLHGLAVWRIGSADTLR